LAAGESRPEAAQPAAAAVNRDERGGVVAIQESAVVANQDAAGGAAGQDAAANQDMEEESGKKDDVGFSVPIGRVKRIMRCHPDKKKSFSKEAVNAIAAGMVRRSLRVSGIAKPPQSDVG
jgi:hypothetical protein